SASPSSSVVMVHDFTSFPPYKAGSESFSSPALKFSEGEGGPGLFLTRFLRDGWLLDRFEEVEDGTERGPVHDVARRHHGGPGGEVVADRREDAEARRPALVADRPDQQRVADAGRDPPVRAARQQGEGHAGGDAEAEVGQGRQDALAGLGAPLAAREQAADDVLGRLGGHEAGLLPGQHDRAHGHGGGGAAEGAAHESVRHEAAAARAPAAETQVRRAAGWCSRARPARWPARRGAPRATRRAAWPARCGWRARPSPAAAGGPWSAAARRTWPAGCRRSRPR